MHDGDTMAIALVTTFGSNIALWKCATKNWPIDYILKQDDVFVNFIYNGMTPLHMAAKHGCTEAVMALLAHGKVNINQHCQSSVGCQC